MRTEFIKLFAEINAKELELLTAEVKETVAVDHHETDAKPVFTAANLWRIHSMKKAIATRRYFLS